MLTKTFKETSWFKERREKLAENVENSVLILFSGHESYLSRFRAESSFVYLTGFEEPEAWVVIRTGESPTTQLFVRDKDPSIEIWDGERFGPELAQEEFAVDFAFSNQELSDRLPELIRGVDKLFYNLGADDENDRMVLEARERAQQLDRRSGRGQSPIYDPKDILAPMRVIKDEHELGFLKDSCELSAQAHIEAMKATRPGGNERQIQGVLLKAFYDQLAFQEGYSSIVASGVNATTLHYRANNTPLADGELLLIDAGAEKSYYTADITRTFPVNGQFTNVQKEFYQSVLNVQKKLIPYVQPGFSLVELQEKACVLLTEAMVELGLLNGRVPDLVADKSYQKYYPHGVGHYLGMDVHDFGFSKHNDKPVAFEKNMVITVEPGLYVPHDDETAPKELRGLGVRIEDDVVVGSKDPIVLTEKAPKEIQEIESVMNS